MSVAPSSIMPQELWQIAFSYLSIKKVMEIKTVCKEWESIASKVDFLNVIAIKEGFSFSSNNLSLWKEKYKDWYQSQTTIKTCFQKIPRGFIISYPHLRNPELESFDLYHNKLSVSCIVDKRLRIETVYDITSMPEELYYDYYIYDGNSLNQKLSHNILLSTIKDLQKLYHVEGIEYNTKKQLFMFSSVRQWSVDRNYLGLLSSSLGQLLSAKCCSVSDHSSYIWNYQLEDDPNIKAFFCNDKWLVLLYELENQSELVIHWQQERNVEKKQLSFPHARYIRGFLRQDTLFLTFENMINIWDLSSTDQQPYKIATAASCQLFDQYFCFKEEDTYVVKNFVNDRIEGTIALKKGEMPIAFNGKTLVLQYGDQLIIRKWS